MVFPIASAPAFRSSFAPAVSESSKAMPDSGPPVPQRSSSFSKSTASALLDLLRGSAALVVCVGHWRNLLFLDFPSVHSKWLALPYLLTSCGRQAVIIFFVLSGYLIGGSIKKSLEVGDWSWARYSVQRLVRLEVVLLPGLVFCCLWDWAGIHFGQIPGLYLGADQSSVIANVHATTSLWAFLGNVAFLQGIRVPPFGSDAPLWSLSYEFWYYLLFPAALLAIGSWRGAGWRIVSALSAMGIVFLLPRGILLYFPIWLSGAVLAWVAPRLPIVPVTWRIVTAILYIPLMIAMAKINLVPDFLHGALIGIGGDYVLAAATLMLLVAALSARGPAPRALWVTFSRRAAGFSYALYVVHLPFLVFLTSIARGEQRWYPDAAHILLGLALLGIVFGYAWTVAIVTEFRTTEVRLWVERRLGMGLDPKYSSVNS
jgi:peptidoglycan/LPS O-acetylase OafA/YrhL